MRRKNPGRTFVATCVWLACWTSAAGLLDGVSGKHKYCDIRYFTVTGACSGRVLGVRIFSKSCCKFTPKMFVYEVPFYWDKSVLSCYEPPLEFIFVHVPVPLNIIVKIGEKLRSTPYCARVWSAMMVRTSNRLFCSIIRQSNFHNGFRLVYKVIFSMLLTFIFPILFIKK